ncbi:MAG TPA: dihydroneopterin aldolase [Acidimicrobiia bacterium]|nr:dihydroneopterin aldolase [Acidimicrobiia bacterium]
MSDRIQVTGIEVFAHHGVLEEEQRDGQLFSVDVEIELDLRRAAHTDDLADTADYGELAERVSARVAEERWNLIEKVAQRVADLVLEDERVQATTVTVHKPQAPISVPFRDVTVTVRRSR